MLPRARAVMLTNYNEVARFVGLEPYEMLARAGINAADLHNPENWLAAQRVLSLIDESAVQSGRDDFGILLGKCRTFTSMGPVSLLLKHEATVRDIIQAAVEYRYLLNDLLHVIVRDDGGSATVEWNLIPGLQSPQGVNMVAAATYKAISEALEASWEPDCIHFRHARATHHATFSRFFRCSLEFDSQFDGMSCASKALLTPNPFANADLAAYARRLLNLLPVVRDDSAADKVRSVILLVIDDGDPTVERVADCLGAPVRTLQRQLAAENHSFGSLLNEIRRELAHRYLEHSSHDVMTIAHLTGYATAQSFTRWFTSEFRIPPAQWRKLRRNPAGLGPKAVLPARRA